MVTLIRKVGIETAQKLAARGMVTLANKIERNLLLDTVSKRLADKVLQVGMQTVVTSGHRVVHEAFLYSSMGGVGVYQGPDGVYQAHLDAGHKPGSFWDKLPKALACHLVQNSMEHMGGLLGEVPGLKRMFEGMTEAAREELMKRALLRTTIEKMGVDKAMRFLAAHNEKLRDA